MLLGFVRDNQGMSRPAWVDIEEGEPRFTLGNFTTGNISRDYLCEEGRLTCHAEGCWQIEMNVRA
jgi:hypothetical protein